MKLHLLLDHDRYLPSFAVITEGKVHEIQVARKLKKLQRGTMLVCIWTRAPGIMLQKLIADRFKLTSHHEQKELSVY